MHGWSFPGHGLVLFIRRGLLTLEGCHILKRFSRPLQDKTAIFVALPFVTKREIVAKREMAPVPHPILRMASNTFVHAFVQQNRSPAVGWANIALTESHFTYPEVARVGFNEIEAKAQNIAYRSFKVPMEANLRARTLSETRGFLKALVEEPVF